MTESHRQVLKLKTANIFKSRKRIYCLSGSLRDYSTISKDTKYVNSFEIVMGKSCNFISSRYRNPLCGFDVFSMGRLFYQCGCKEVPVAAEDLLMIGEPNGSCNMQSQDEILSFRWMEIYGELMAQRKIMTVGKRFVS